MKNVCNLFSLKNKCAVVIGGKGKVGYPISMALAEAGAKVFIASRTSCNEDKEIKTLRDGGLDVSGVELDVTRENQINSFINKLTQNNLAPDIMVNSGLVRPMKQLLGDSIESWAASMHTNANGLFLSCRAFAENMASNNGGSIINITSIYGLVAPDPQVYIGTKINTEPDYPFIKGGMIMFSKYLASYYSKHDVRVNCIAPGGVFNHQDEKFITNYIKKVPLKRMATQDDLKGAAVFLASQASSYITGVVIPVDGGYTIL